MVDKNNQKSDMDLIIEKKEHTAVKLREEYGNIKATSFIGDGYTVAEWQSRKQFEIHGTEEETYSGTIGMGDLSGFDV